MFLIALLVACGSEPATSVTAPVVAAPAPAPVPALDKAQLAAAANRVLAPSPEETRLVLERAGIATDVAALVPRRTFRFDTPDKDVVAVRTGVLLSDTVLTLTAATDEELVGRLEQVHAGLTAMGAGKGLLDTVQGLTEQTRNKGIARADLLRSIDETVSRAVPEDGVGPDDRTGPLLQAGAWLATIHVAAQATLASDKLDAAGPLFHQKPVVDWFLGYLATDAQGKAPDALLVQLEATLKTLGGLAGKFTFTREEVQQIETSTAQLLALI